MIFDYTVKTWINVATLVSIPKVRIDETIRSDSEKAVDSFMSSIRAKGRQFDFTSFCTYCRQL